MKQFVITYKYRNIYKVTDGVGMTYFIAEPISTAYTTIVTKTADTIELLYKEIEKDILFTKLHPVKIY